MQKYLQIVIIIKIKLTQIGTNPTYHPSLEIEKTPTPSATSPLESELMELSTQPLDFEITAQLLYRDLEPNEGYVEKVQSLLPPMNALDGTLVVTTGTERAFFLGCFLPETIEGIVVIDHNPKVIAYDHFNILLLRISDSLDEYFDFSKPSSRKTPDYEHRISMIEAKINATTIPADLREYYIKNLRIFANIYFKVQQAWRDNQVFEKTNYSKHSSCFQILSHFAKHGKIIPICRNINDLTCLKSFEISVIDASNINQYIPFNFQMKQVRPPTLITTKLLYHLKTEYSSIQNPPINTDSNTVNKINHLIEKIKKAHNHEGHFSLWFSEVFCAKEIRFYNEEFKDCLTAYIDQHLCDCPHIGLTDLSVPCLESTQIKQIRYLPDNERTEVINFLKNHPLIKINIKQLKQTWMILPKEIYYALFSEVEGWAEVFELEKKKPRLKDFLLKWDPDLKFSD